MPNTTTKAIAVRDFSGGLWLNEGRPPNSRYYVRGMNLDVDTAGGLVRRRPIRHVAEKTATTLAAGFYLDAPSDSATGQSYFHHQTVKFNTSEFWTLVHEQGAVDKLHRWNVSGTLTASITLNGATAKNYNSIVEAGGKLYVSEPHDLPDRVDGSGTVTAMTDAYNDDLTAPVGGHMPAHGTACVHLAYLFVASGTTGTIAMNKARLRWSHPGQYEDWRTNDFQDVGATSEAIMGIYSWREQLIILKEHSIWVMTGYSPDTFEWRLVHDFGAGMGASTSSSPPAPSKVGIVCGEVSPYGVFFHVARNGVFLFDGSGLHEVSLALRDAFVDGRIPAQATRLSWCGDRVVLHVTPSYTYTRALSSYTSTSASAGFAWEYFPDTKRWTQHSYQVDDIVDVGYTSGTADSSNYVSFTTWNNGSNKYGYSWSQWRGALKSGSEGYYDSYINNTDNNPKVHFRTGWIEPLPSQVKRWRRPYIVMNPLPATGSAETDTTTVNLYRDYDSTGLVKAVKTGFLVRSMNLATGSYYSSSFGWGHDGEQRDLDVPAKLIPGGRAVACQLELISDATKAYGWGFEEITFKVVPMRLK